MQEAIDALNGHFVLCGYGRVGATVARELVDAGESVVVVDLIQESLERAREDGHLVVLGDATTDAILRQAGVERATGLVTAIDTDALNVYVILSARQLNPGAHDHRPGEHAGGRGEAPPGRRRPHRLALHPGRPPDGRAGRAARRRRLSRRRARPSRAAFGLESVAVVAGRGLDGRIVGESAPTASSCWPSPTPMAPTPATSPTPPTTEPWPPASRSSPAAMRPPWHGCEREPRRPRRQDLVGWTTVAPWADRSLGRAARLPLVGARRPRLQSGVLSRPVPGRAPRTDPERRRLDRPTSSSGCPAWTSTSSWPRSSRRARPTSS